MAFVELNNLEKLDELFEKSNEKPVVLFKHSITCPISGDAANQMSIVDSDVNIVIVQTSRAISNEIETRTNIRHQSPQTIILKGGQPIFNASHYSITADKIEEILKNN
ncbi:MAG: bacillithiol system redox-active protein YtxJ [Pyrinomonadaceae bacterium]|jgi:bacillithiol system protein YtxJ|nr:bacillithiol system redox-active protein YtxJ [Pyrinomonadaceae bacterium]